MKNSLIKLLISVIAGVVLAVGWGVNVQEIGFLRFLGVWVIGSVLLTEISGKIDV